MERYGRLKIAIGCDARFCAECGSPELEDGCSNPACWKARANSKFPISMALQQLAIESTFPAQAVKRGFLYRYVHSFGRGMPAAGFSRTLSAHQRA